MENNNNQKKKLSFIQKQLIIIALIIVILLIISLITWMAKAPTGEDGKRVGYVDFMYSLITGNKEEEPKKEKSNQPKYDKDGDLLGVQDRPYIYDVIPLENVATIEVQNIDPETGLKRSFSFYMDPVAKNLILSGREMLSFNKEKLSYLYVNTCNTLTMMKVEDPDKDTSQYGLPDGVSDTWFKVTTLDGKEHKVYIGDKFPTGAAYYCKSADKPHIYIIDTMIEQCVLASPDDYIVPMLAPPISQADIYKTNNIKIVSGGELKISLECIASDSINKDDGVSFSHVMTYPGGYTVSQTKVDTLLGKLSNFVGSAVEEADLFGAYKTDADEAEQDKILKETLEKYGLIHPSHEIHYTNGDNSYKVIFGAKTPDKGSYYAMNLSQMTICTVPCTDVAFLDYELIDFVDEYIFQMSIDNLASVEVSTKNSKEKFLLSGSGQELAIKAESGKVSVNTKTFRQFYIDVLLVRMTGKADSTDTSSEVLSYCFETRDGRRYEYKFYDISTTKVYYTVNGVGEFYVNRDSVNKVINNFDKLMAGESFLSEALGG